MLRAETTISNLATTTHDYGGLALFGLPPLLSRTDHPDVDALVVSPRMGEASDVDPDLEWVPLDGLDGGGTVSRGPLSGVPPVVQPVEVPSRGPPPLDGYIPRLQPLFEHGVTQLYTNFRCVAELLSDPLDPVMATRERNDVSPECSSGPINGRTHNMDKCNSATLTPERTAPYASSITCPAPSWGATSAVSSASAASALAASGVSTITLSGSDNARPAPSCWGATSAASSASPLPLPNVPAVTPETAAWMRDHVGDGPNTARILDGVLGESTLCVYDLRVYWCVKGKRIAFDLPEGAHGYRLRTGLYTGHHLCWPKLDGRRRRALDAQKEHKHKAATVEVISDCPTGSKLWCKFVDASGGYSCPLYVDLELIRDSDGHELSVRVGPLFVLSRSDQAVKRQHGPWGASLQVPVEQAYEGAYGGRRVTLQTRGPLDHGKHDNDDNDSSNSNSGKRRPSKPPIRKGERTKKAKNG